MVSSCLGHVKTFQRSSFEDVLKEEIPTPAP